MRVLITGGAKRVGRLLVTKLAAKGHKLAIHYNSSDIEAMKLLSEIGGTEAGHMIVQANLADLNETNKIIPQLLPWGKPAILINNASTYFRRGLNNFTNEELLEDYTINFFSPLALMREFNKHSGYGSIINILDKRVNHIEPEAGPYSLAKKSLRDATLACAQEWYPNIRVNAVAPGPILLPDESIEDAENKEKLNELCEQVIYLSEHDIHGQVIEI
ncbi:MAG: SDR family NAD(P)-dependent oxidoreductase [Lentisphaeraceae bacterium]|nr:SDR family NAD(P)-dependent oxidoreductase [Lentisphaeraceae bacterium]